MKRLASRLRRPLVVIHVIAHVNTAYVRARCARFDVAYVAQRAQHLREMAAVAHLHAEEHREHVAAVGTLHRHGVDVARRRRRSPSRDRRAARGGRRRAGGCPPRTRPRTSGAHSTSTSCSASTRCFLSVTQSRVCTSRPWPRRNWPTTESPGIGRQHLRVLDRHAFDAAQRQRRRAWRPCGASPARRPCPAPCVSACATTNDSRLPSPMSARMSSWLFAPYSFASASQRSHEIASGSTLSVASAWFEQPLAERRRFLLLQALQVMADARARLAGGDERQPRRIRARGRRRQDLDVVAVLELGAQRQQLVVDARRDAVVADVGVHAVREVDRGRAARQRHDLALRREHVDLVGEEVALDVLEEFLRVARLRLDLEQALQPARRLALRLGEVELAAGLVQPVRGDARLGDAVHVVRADLRLERRAERAEQRRVQRLVAVRLRDRDVVLELAGNRLVQARAARRAPRSRSVLSATRTRTP